MKDLQFEDCTYDNDFPGNLDLNCLVVVQIPETGQGVVLYRCSRRGNQTSCYLPLNFASRYTNKIYLFNTK